MLTPIRVMWLNCLSALLMRSMRTLSCLLLIAASCGQHTNAGVWGDIKKALDEDGQASLRPASNGIVAQNVSVVVHAGDVIVWNSATVMPSFPESTVIDSATGLMWMRCAMGQEWVKSNCRGSASIFTWNEAVKLKRSFAGYQDWRLPTIRELQTLVELGKNSPAIDAQIFPWTPGSELWSASPYAYNSEVAWGVDFDSGNTFLNGRSYGAARVRLVRGGRSLEFLSEPAIASADAIHDLIVNRKWSTGEKSSYAMLAETNLRLAQAAHQEPPEQLKEMNTRLRVVPSVPPKLTKDEFETSAAFQARIVESQAVYEAKVAEYNHQVADYERKMTAHYAQLGPLPDEQRQQAIRAAFLKSYGAPKLSKLRYEADIQSFYAFISTEDGGDLGKQIVLRDIPPDQARKLKPALEVAQPDVRFRINSDNSLTWELINLYAGQQNLVAVPVNSVDETQRVEVAIKALDVAKPNIVMPRPIALQKIEFDIRADPTIAAQQAEIDRVKRQRAQAEATVTEQKRLKEELARLQQSTPLSFNDDLPLLLARAPAAKTDKHLHVLSVGIGDYADVADVPFADRSATLFADLAKKTLGALPENIITLTNQEATSGRLRGRLSTLLGRLTKEDRLLIYFAGHGVPAQDGKNVFLLAQDGGPGSYEESDLQLNALYDRVSRSRVGQAQLFIDACFSGRSNKNSMILGGIGGVAIVPKHGITADSRLTVMIAGRAEQLSNQHEARGHRLFGYHLMHALLNDGLKLSVGELHSKIRGRVLADSLRLGVEFEQEPELLGNPTALLKK